MSFFCQAIHMEISLFATVYILIIKTVLVFIPQL